MLAGEYRLNLAVADIAEQVETVSGKGIDFRSVPKLDGRARAKMARGRMEQHLVLFNPNERPHLSHILAHECARMLRQLRPSVSSYRSGQTGQTAPTSSGTRTWGDDSVRALCYSSRGRPRTTLTSITSS